jgi:CHAT domain-containing protein
MNRAHVPGMVPPGTRDPRVSTAGWAFAACLVGLTAAFPPPLPAAESAAIDSLSAIVEELRYAGRYDAAVEAARNLLRLAEGDPATPSWVREDAIGELRELERIVALPPEQRRELGRAHRWQEEIADHFAHARYAEAETLARQQREVFSRILGGVDFDTGLACDNLAVCLDAQGDLAGAERSVQQALGIFRQVLPHEHPQILQTLNTIAVLLYRRGDYAGAEPFLREIIGLQRTLQPVDDESTALYLYNLGSCLLEQGIYAEAQDWLREALRAYRSQPGKEREAARCLMGLGRASLARGEGREGTALLEEAVSASEHALGPDHPEVAQALYWLADARQSRTDQRDPAEADRLFSRALTIMRAGLGDGHPEVAKILCRLGMLRASQNRLDEAHALLEQARSSYAASLGEEHRYVAFCLQMLATLEYTTGDLAAAESHARRAAEIYEQARRRAGFGLERATFQRSPYAELAAAQLALGEQADAWESVERMQGRLLVDLLMRAERRPITADEAAREDSLEAALGRLEREVSVLRQAIPSDSAGTIAARRDAMGTRLLGAQAAWQAFERALALKYPASEGWGYSLPRVQATLDPDAAILGWLDFEDLGGAFSSWAYAIRSRGPVQWARLPSASATTPRDRVRAWRDRLASAASPSDDVHQRARELYAERIAPIAEALHDARTLIVVPSGVMVGIPLEALEDASGRYLGEAYELSYAPSATVSAWLTERGRERSARDRATARSAALLVGDPDFGAPEPVADDDRRPPPGEERPHVIWAPSHPREDTTRATVDTRGLRRSILPRLPGTRAEIEALAPLWHDARVLLGEDASEAALFDLARSGEIARFGVLHFATHAFVDDDRPEASTLELSAVEAPPPGVESFADHGFDGVVTAQEILREWTLNADLVTLSACETALGRRVAGEGYVGFADAFLQAGARSLLVSLWQVEDRSTALLMRRFYELWTGGGVDARKHPAGLSKAEALRQAKRWLRDQTDPSGSKPYAQPYSWAGFVLLGDPS